MPLLSLDPVPMLETQDSGLLLFRDNVQLNYNKIQDIVNKLDSANIADGSVTIADLVNGGSGTVVTLVSYQAVAGVATYNGGAWADYPGPHDISITKKYDATKSKLVVFGTVGAYKATNIGIILVGLRFGGVEHQIGSFHFNALGTHALASCQDDTFAGIGAGVQVGRVRWDVTTVNINTDANDAVRLTLLEVII